jgi:hypothetical protein
MSPYCKISSFVAEDKILVSATLDYCVEKLKEYDTVGCNLYLHSECRSHYSGNFWWAKTSYLRTLPYLSMISRHEAELWLLMNHKCKLYSMHNSCIDHYRSSYPKKIYT